MEELVKIKGLIDRGEIANAIELLDQYIDDHAHRLDEAYYLKGNAFRKLSDWQQALNNYQRAIDINPASPAAEAKRMVMDILNFYNKDMYNQ